MNRGSMRAVRAIWQDRHGSALVEGALLLPVLCVLMFGIYEFSWLFYQQHLISIGLRDAARYLARWPDPCNGAAPDWVAAEENAKKLATTGSVDGGPPRVRGWTSAMVLATCTAFDNAAGANGSTIFRGRPMIYVITVSTRFADPALGFFGFLGLRTPFISLAHSERAIGPG
jgi:TadE-like protein